MEGSWVGCACQRERGGGRAVLRALCARLPVSLSVSLSLCACVLCVHLPPIVCFQFDVWFTLPSISFLVVLRFEKIINKEEEEKKK